MTDAVRTNDRRKQSSSLNLKHLKLQLLRLTLSTELYHSLKKQGMAVAGVSVSEGQASEWGLGT